ncbi:hypothetical protein DPM13_17440 [Paracoccus mutanolyticus]|uniref:Uncharacterized protein n=1 Tax=Paracoccus mutanolyticus TaxID=1499308 RepID=A0ABM6WU09_9RHOB|nr:hypothetical protein [Paracoccus mutanolyticus]AWX94110.1 hypothetical protein DPM13_17440 [Paracoccus mutanolyticus]
MLLHAAALFLAPQVDRSVFLSQDIFAEWHYDKMGRLDAAIMTLVIVIALRRGSEGRSELSMPD